MTDEALLKLLRDHDLGVLATLLPDGRPHLSTIKYGVNEAGVVRVSITAGRIKTKNLRRDPRASLHVSSANGWSWVVAEGSTELSSVAHDPHDDAVEELVELYRSVAGDHPDWDDYRRSMVADERLVLRLHPQRLYGQAG